MITDLAIANSRRRLLFWKLPVSLTSTVMGLFLFSAILVPARVGWAGKNEMNSDTFKYITQPWTGDLDGMRHRRYIRVLVVHSKTNFFLDGAAQRGITSEIFLRFETWLNQKLKTKAVPIHIVFIPVKRDELFSALLEGKGDIAAANLTITPERLKLVDFSMPFTSNVREVIVGGPASPPVTKLTDLSGKEVYVRINSSYYASLMRLNEDFHQTGLPPVLIREADENLESEDIMEMVGAGLLPLTVVDEYRADFWARIIPTIKVRGDLAIAEGREIACAFRKNSPILETMLNGFIPTIKKSADLVVLGKKYFSNIKYIQNSLASKDFKRFQNAVALFRKYSDQYNMDYLLVAAQAYQESRIDQSARSRAGAIGIMQLLPATAANPPINIPDIQHKEKNIHAGVKYHRHIIDTYFNSPDISPLNQMLFAFAAYNAGPGNMRKMRRMTERMGLDPNTWFANVELAAARITGQETVRYVGNIYKYYLAYRLVTAQAKEKERLTAFPGVPKGSHTSSQPN